MNKKYSRIKLIQLVIAAIFIVQANLGLAASYRPPLAKFTGIDSVTYPDDISLEFKRFATIEFWVAASWNKLDYDPAILSYLGDQGARFAVLMQADRKGIGFMAGQKWAVAPFDFSDGKLHHVAFIVIDSRTTVFVDSEIIAIMPISIADLPSRDFNIGSFNGRDAQFIGSLAGLRIWDTALDPDDIAAYRLIDLKSEEGLKHPEIDSLVGTSAVENGKLVFVLTEEPLSLNSPEPVIDAVDVDDMPTESAR